jgi:hypothetical protein
MNLEASVIGIGSGGINMKADLTQSQRQQLGCVLLFTLTMLFYFATCCAGAVMGSSLAAFLDCV